MTDLLGTYTKPLAFLGLFTLGKTAFSLTRQAITYLLPSTLQRYNPTKTNWALVTGATDGIGFGFGQELCARGFNVILHGRNAEKLERRRSELQALFPAVYVAVIVRDAQNLTADIDDVDAEVRDIIRRSNETAGSDSQGHPGRLTVLINNVGGETRPSTLLKEYTFEDVQATISRNATFAIQITRVLATQLEENAPGLVMNVSSLASFGMPYISIYSSTKGFVDSFTKSLHAEFAAEGKKIEVVGLRVGEVRTAGFDVKTNLFVPEARVLAAAALDRVGCGQEIVWAYFWHWLQGLSFDYLPRWMLMKVAVMKMKAIRADLDAKVKSS
ncbi:Short-chain dehydrogenase/reductase SDR [Penicillium expansum]|uniref:Short-chain dehydrogenase/reductase SDR n=1 Tax=Penicillium expansum TaxID=27334 RepID=A0A0A2K5H5_PENEN|nr:Short-chain dehydrogenase/reductase SDR [Penicillium expansum]KGO40599.1 Short-chain dehydrogenase/reductase SDR [Penicillium expansum]KGO48877.1 Short-chain dehydrogenase/reductase SDR [Penicillium expansum]KGO63072.1 Short-chain dehydrogenase/reductase SDR [Penicillium expansum]